MYRDHPQRFSSYDGDDDFDLEADSAVVSAGDSGLGVSSSTSHSRRRQPGEEDEKPPPLGGLVSRDGKSSMSSHHEYLTKYSPNAPGGGLCSYSDQRVDSGFDSYNFRSGERLNSSDSNYGGFGGYYPYNDGSMTSSFHSTSSVTTTSDSQNIMKTSTTSTTTSELMYDPYNIDDSKRDPESVIDSGIGLSEQCISTDSAVDVTDKFDKLNICGREIYNPSAQHPTTTSVPIHTPHYDVSPTYYKLSHSPPKPVPIYAQGPSTGSVSNFRWIDAFEQDIDGDTTLHLAIIHELSKEVLNLIDNVPHPTYLNLQNNLLQTPLHLAVLTNQPKIVRRLVITGAALDMRDRRGNTALHIACQEGSLDCTTELLDTISYNEIANTSHHLLEGYGRLPDMELRNYDGQNCVHLATRRKHIDILRALRQYGADMNAQEGKSGRTALHYAVEAKDIELVRFLVSECQADMNVQTFAGLTPIQLAYNHNERMVYELMSLGAYDVGPPPSDSESDSSSEEMTSMDTKDDGDCGFLVNGVPLSSF